MYHVHGVLSLICWGSGMQCGASRSRIRNPASTNARCAAFCSERTANYDATSTITFCYPPDSQADLTMPEAYNVISVAGTCVFEELPFEPTAADFKAKLTQLYTGLSADCKVRAAYVAQVSNTDCSGRPACVVLATSSCVLVAVA